MKIFENLPEEDLKLLLGAPVLVTILIGSADGHLDNDEIAEGHKVTLVKEKNGVKILQPYYSQVAESYDEMMKEYISILPKDAKLRNEEISNKLSELNRIYKNLDNNFVEQLNKSLRSLAEQIAKASGGILGFGSESYEEKQWVDLSMIKK